MRKVVRSGLWLLGILAAATVLLVLTSGGWANPRGWASAVGLGSFMCLGYAGMAAKETWIEHPRFGGAVHLLAFMIGIAIAAVTPGMFTVPVGTGIAAAAANSAYVAFKPQLGAEWRRVARPLRPLLDVVWGDANTREPPKA